MALRRNKSTDDTSGEAADETTSTTTTDDKSEQKPVKTKTDRTATAKAAADSVRSRVAQLIWIVCVVAALILAVAALCIALKANSSNSLVKFVEDTADKLDFGVFSRGKDGVAHFKGHSHAADTKNALVNWGLAAVVWLVGGRIVERVIRP
jgi:hypothetical protein